MVNFMFKNGKNPLWSYYVNPFFPHYSAPGSKLKTKAKNSGEKGDVGTRRLSVGDFVRISSQLEDQVGEKDYPQETELSTYKSKKALYILALAVKVESLFNILEQELDSAVSGNLNNEALSKKLDGFLARFTAFSSILAKIPVEVDRTATVTMREKLNSVMLETPGSGEAAVAFCKAAVSKLKSSWDVVFSEGNQLASSPLLDSPPSSPDQPSQQPLAADEAMPVSQDTGLTSKDIYPSDLDTRLGRHVTLPVSTNEFQDLLSKLSYGRELEAQERESLKSINLADLARLVGTGGIQLDLFRVKRGDVIRVIFGFSDKSVYSLGKEYLSSATKKTTLDTTQNTDNLKPLEAKLELFYIVTENKEVITSTFLLEEIHTKLFQTNLKQFLPSAVMLETIQYQVVYPVKTKGTFFQINVPSQGGFVGEGFAMSKPFVLGATPGYIGGSKNAFKILFPFFSSSFKDPFTVQKYSDQLENLRKALVQPLILGSDADLVLSLAVKSSKLSVLPFLPVQSASWAGFNANVRIRNARAARLSMADQASLIDATVGNTYGTESFVVAAESTPIKSAETDSEAQEPFLETKMEKKRSVAKNDLDVQEGTKLEGSP